MDFLLLVLMVATILGPAAVIGAIGHAAIQALGRNPSAAPKIMMAMVTALIFVEALAIVALLLVAPLVANHIELAREVAAVGG